MPRDSGQFLFPSMERVIYGRPCAEVIREECERLASERVFLIVSRTLNGKTDEIEKVREALGQRHAGTYDGIPQHTSRTEVVHAARKALAVDADLVVAVGGGSVVDAGKMILMCMEHKIVEEDGLDGYEIVVGPDGRRRPSPFRMPKARLIAVPSTLSGGEYNAGCLVTDDRRKLKHTFYHPMMMPRSIILDPFLVRHTPMQLWLGSGTRAMDHGIEAVSSLQGNPLVDAVVLRGLRYLHDGLLQTKDHFDDIEARRQCQFGSWLSAFGLQNRVPMGASHAIGHVLGGSCDVPHYLCTPVMLPSVMRFNEKVTQEAQAQIAEALRAPNLDAAEALERFVATLGLPTRLSQVGVTPSQFQTVGEITMTEIFTQTNPRPIRGPSDVIEILKLAA
jgi:maleylacetate reductase